jgi:hypothetical protein
MKEIKYTILYCVHFVIPGSGTLISYGSGTQISYGSSSATTKIFGSYGSGSATLLVKDQESNLLAGLTTYHCSAGGDIDPMLELPTMLVNDELTPSIRSVSPIFMCCPCCLRTAGERDRAG